MSGRFYTAFSVHGTIVWQSRTAPQYKKSEMIGTKAWDWVHKSEVEQCKLSIARAIVAKDEVSCTFRGVRDDHPYNINYVHLPEHAVVMAETTTDIEENLTEREITVLLAICRDESPKLTAERLKVSVSTIEAFRASLKRKLNARGTAGLVRAAIRMGIVHASLVIAHLDFAPFGKE